MTKEKYIELRNTNELSFEILWDYYCINIEENKRLVKTIEEFIPLFQIFMQQGFLNFEKIFQYYDNKFNITKIINIKDSKIIRYA